MEEKIKSKKLKLADDVEYIIIQNEETNEIIVEITRDKIDVIKPYVVRIKYKKD